MLSSLITTKPRFVEEKKPKDFFFESLRAFDLDQRKAESSRILKKYPNRIPVIVDRGDAQTPSISKHKYLVPGECTMQEFQSIIRSKVNLDPSQALFLFVGSHHTLSTPSSNMNQMYKQHKDEDGYLYITYMLETTFG